MRKTAKQVIAEVAALNNLEVADLVTSSSRVRKFSWPRQQAMFEVYLQCPHLSYPAIAKAFGGMDHTTIIHGVKEHCKRSGFDYGTIKRVRPKSEPVRRPAFRNTPSSAQAYREAARVAH